jgi:acetyl esterase/lipase
MLSILARSFALASSSLAVLSLALAASTTAQEPQKAEDRKPTFEDVSYGPHPRNVLDFWQARTDRPAPVVVFIHGGGFVAGDKTKARGSPAIGQCLDKGVHFASINYRYRSEVPIQHCLRDGARAIQFLRTRADAWKIDPKRVAAFGSSAGASTSLWLAFHDDLADPANADPVLRQSTRLSAAGSLVGQVSLDILRWPELFGDDVARFHLRETWPGLYGLKTNEDLQSPEGKRIRADLDFPALVTRDDPPVFLSSGLPDTEPKTKGELNHHPRHMKVLKDRCDAVGVPAVLVLPAVKTDQPGSPDDRAVIPFLLKRLGAG